MPYTLREARCHFTAALADLIHYARSLGYEVALAEGMDRPTAKDPTTDHRPGSLHEIGLAQDIDLYRDGVWLSKSEDHLPLGTWWELYGKAREWPLRWGGHWQDGNHYSWEWQGKR